MSKNLWWQKQQLHPMLGRKNPNAVLAMKKVNIGRKHTKAVLAMQKANIGRKHTNTHIEKISNALKGDKNPAKRLEVRKKLSEAHKGEKSYLWKGGISPENKRVRKGIEFRLWRESVFARDNWTCQKCLERGGTLHPHHIKNFAEYPELRLAIDNGITFCQECHEEFHKIYGKRNNSEKQLKEYF